MNSLSESIISTDDCWVRPGTVYCTATDATAGAVYRSDREGTSVRFIIWPTWLPECKTGRSGHVRLCASQTRSCSRWSHIVTTAFKLSSRPNLGNKKWQWRKALLCTEANTRTWAFQCHSVNAEPHINTKPRMGWAAPIPIFRSSPTPPRPSSMCTALASS